MSLAGPGNGSESGPSTLVGENMGLIEDPFSGRMNAFRQKNRHLNRRSEHLTGSNFPNMIRRLESDDDSNYGGSMMSGNFGGQIKTPGFTSAKTFNFGAADANGDDDAI